MDRARFNHINYYSDIENNFSENFIIKNTLLFFINVGFEPEFFYIDFSLPENRHLRPEDFFSLNLLLLYIKTIDIYWKKRKQYIYITKVYKNNLIFINLVSF